MYGPPRHSPSPLLFASSSSILVLSSSQTTGSQALLNSPHGRGQTSLDHIPSSMVSILPGKLAAELKSAHLFIPVWLCFSHMAPVISPLPSPSDPSCCNHSSVAARWRICLGGGEEGEKRRKGEWSPLFPAAAANQSKLPAQLAHCISGATPKT